MDGHLSLTHKMWGSQREGHDQLVRSFVVRALPAMLYSKQTNNFFMVLMRTCSCHPAKGVVRSERSPAVVTEQLTNCVAGLATLFTEQASRIAVLNDNTCGGEYFRGS